MLRYLQFKEEWNRSFKRRSESSRDKVVNLTGSLGGLPKEDLCVEYMVM